jgi:hypothetical protein
MIIVLLGLVMLKVHESRSTSEFQAIQRHGWETRFIASVAAKFLQSTPGILLQEGNPAAEGHLFARIYPLRL